MIRSLSRILHRPRPETDPPAPGGPLRHPGTVLRLDFMLPHGLTTYRVARDIGVPAPRIHAVLAAKRAVTPDTALRLARYFGTTPEYWTNLQAAWDLARAREALADELDRIRPRGG